MMMRVILLMLVAGLISCPIALANEDWAAEGPPATLDVVLDPGHSDADVGAAGGGLRESDLTLKLAIMVQHELASRGFSVALTRQDHNPLTDLWTSKGVSAIQLEQEARIAAAGKAGAYVSLHFNGHPNPGIRGAETYFNGDNHGAESQLLGSLIQYSLLDAVRETGYPLLDRGVKEDLWASKPYGHFFSLRGDMPSVLVESMFLSNPEEAELLAYEETLAALAQGIARGIETYLSQDLVVDRQAPGEDQ